jgi:hypothetical protein
LPFFITQFYSIFHVIPKSPCFGDVTFKCQQNLEAQQQTITPQQLEEQKKKAEKFKAYYQKSEKCLSPIDHDTRVACGNEHIRAKAKFEELYQQGKL